MECHYRFRHWGRLYCNMWCHRGGCLGWEVHHRVSCGFKCGLAIATLLWQSWHNCTSKGTMVSSGLEWKWEIVSDMPFNTNSIWGILAINVKIWYFLYTSVVAVLLCMYILYAIQLHMYSYDCVNKSYS